MFKKVRLAATLGAFALGASLLAPMPSQATTATGTMSVTATVTNSCTTTAATLTLGAYDFNVAKTGNAIITVSCTAGTGVASVGLDTGAHPGTTANQLIGGSGSDLIPYTLYQDVALATAWTASAFPAATTYTALSTASTFTVYAKAPAGANVPVGSYADTVGITVTYI
jgi:spore coat protein U-like protein